MKRVTIISSLATLALTAAQFAYTADMPASVTVKYAAEDLSTSQGAKVMYGHLHAAAEEVCKPLARDDLELSSKWRYHSCIQTAMSHAVLDVGSPLLNQYYIQRNGGINSATVALAK
jgi:UrcA family protein